MEVGQGLDFEPQSLGSLGSELLQAIDSPQGTPDPGVTPETAEAPSGFGDTLGGRPSKDITPADIAAAEEGSPRTPEPATPEVPVVPETPATPANGQVDLLGEAQRFGVDVTKYGNDPQKLLQGLLHAQRLVGQRDEYAVWGKQLAENPEAVFQALQAKYGKAPEPPKPEPQGPQTPEFDESWLDLLDANGQPKPGADPNTIAKIKKWNDFAAKRGRELLVNPDKIVMPAIEKRVAELLEARLGEVRKEQDAKLQERDANARLWEEGRQLLLEEKTWIYKDGDPMKGPTPAGEVFDRHLREAVKIGIPSLRAQKEYAKNAAIIEMSQNPAAYTPAQPSAPAAPPRANVVARTPATGTRARQPQADDAWPAGATLASELAKLLN